MVQGDGNTHGARPVSAGVNEAMAKLTALAQLPSVSSNNSLASLGGASVDSAEDGAGGSVRSGARPSSRASSVDYMEGIGGGFGDEDGGLDGGGGSLFGQMLGHAPATSLPPAATHTAPTTSPPTSAGPPTTTPTTATITTAGLPPRHGRV